LLVFGRIPAIERRLVGGELDHGVARSARSFWILEATSPYQELGAVLLERRAVRGDVLLVLLWVRDVDTDDPISLRHEISPLEVLRLRDSDA